MRIERLHIDRFGILAEQDIGELAPGLNVFLGLNEAGKSTCLRFFQSMLFGYKRGNRTLDPTPSRGKALGGGTLALHSESCGRLSLVRRPGAHGGTLTLTDETGQLLDEAILQRLFGGLTIDVFDSIFAFSLKNLMDFSSLKGDSVRHALHGAAFGTGLRSPARVLKYLDERMGALLKRDPASAAINSALRELESVRGEAASRTPDLQLYTGLQRELGTVELRLETLHRERAGQEQSLRRVRRRRDMWRQWEELRRIRAEKEAAGGDDTAESYRFAPDAAQRLDALLARREEQRLAAMEAAQTCARLEAAIAAIPDAPALAGLHREAQALREQKERRRADAEAMPALLMEIAQLAELQSKTLSRLGPGWDEDRIAAADCSLAARAAIQRFEKSLADRERLTRETARDEERLARELEEAVAKEEAARHQAGPEFASPRTLPDKAVCADMAVRLARAEAALEELPGLQAREEQAAAATRRALAAVSPEWSLESLARFDTAGDSRRDVSECGRALARARTLAGETERRADEAGATLAEAAAVLEAARERLNDHAALPDDAELAGRRDRLEALRQALADAALAEREWLFSAEAAGLPLEEEPDRENLAGPAAQKYLALLASSPLFSGGAQLFLAGLALAGGGWLGNFAPLLYAGGLLSAFGPAVMLLAWLSPRPDSQDGPALPALKETARAAGDRLNEARASLRRLAGDASAWSGITTDPLPDADAVSEALRLLDLQIQKIPLRARDAQEALAAAERAGTAERLHARALEERDMAAAAVREREHAWRQILQSLALSPALQPEEAASVCDRAATARALAASAQAASEAVRTAMAVITNCLCSARQHPFFNEALAGFRDEAEGPREDLPGGVPEPDPNHLRRCLSAVGKALSAAEACREAEQERLRLLSVIEERTRAKERAAARLAAMKEARLEALKAMERELCAWEENAAGMGFPPSAPPALANAMLDDMLAFSERAKELSMRENRAESIRGGLLRFIRESAELAMRAGKEPPVELTRTMEGDAGAAVAARIPAALQLLDNVASAAESAARHADLLAEKREQLAASRAARDRMQTALNLSRDALAEMFDSAGVQDAEHFRARFAAQRRRENLDAQERSLLSALDLMAREEGLPMSALTDDLEKSNFSALEEEADKLEQSLSGLDVEAAELAGERGRLLERRSGLAGSGGRAALLGREAALKEVLRGLSRRWAVAALAREILLLAKQRLEEEGQQGVIRHAGDIFAAVTGGEYSGIAAGLEGDAYAAIHHTGDRRDPEKHLSQGAREQLYLSLRLAYVKNHAGKAESVPLIMDDILVNFDPDRAANTARVLADFAADNQMLFFTCHPGMADVLLDAAGKSAAAFSICKGEVSPLHM